MADADFAPVPKTLKQKVLGKYRYRKAENDWQRCSTCENFRIKQHGRKYFKCALLGDSSSPATDINAGHVCDAWSKI